MPVSSRKALPYYLHSLILILHTYVFCTFLTFFTLRANVSEIVWRSGRFPLTCHDNLCFKLKTPGNDPKLTLSDDGSNTDYLVFMFVSAFRLPSFRFPINK